MHTSDPFFPDPFFPKLNSRTLITLTGLLLADIGAAVPAGTLDTSFAPALGPGDGIQALAVQPDGLILAGGTIAPSAGHTCSNLRRYFPNGTEDFAFSAACGTGLDVYPYSIVVQTDGRILLAGPFNSVNGSARTGIARLLPGGTLESTASFNVMLSGGDAYPVCVAVQPDEKILISGRFSSVNGVARTSLARLFPNGTVDASFDAGTHAGNGSSLSGSALLRVEESGRILISTIQGVKRLEANGSLNAVLWTGSTTQCIVWNQPETLTMGGEFVVPVFPSGNSYWGVHRPGLGHFLEFVGGGYSVYSLALQADGKMTAAGYFRTPRRDLARLKADGTVESSAEFVASVAGGGSLGTAILAADGAILIGGGFSFVNGQPQSKLARLLNEPATQTLTITGAGTVIQWLRGGSAPEVSLVTYEQSTDGGQSWTLLGRGARMAGGWELTGQNLPTDAAIRARGRTGDGRSTGLVEQVLNVPEIAVEFPGSTNLNDGRSTVDYGPAVSSTKTFTILNPGTVPLQNLAVSVALGGNAGDFSVTQPASATLAPGATATFTVTFTPGGAGTRTASIQVASNDPDENPFDIAVSGRLATASEAWRILHFGSPDNTGAAADLNDPDGDGLVNLLEFAVDGNPHVFSPPIGTLVKNGATLEFTYSRPTAAVAELNYQLQASITLSGEWTTSGTTSTILSDNGTTQVVKATAPAGTGKRSVRLRVTRL